MFIQSYPLPFWPFLSPLQSGRCREASRGEQQLGPPWEKHMTPSRRNIETEEQKDQMSKLESKLLRLRQSVCADILPVLIKTEVQLWNFCWFRIWKENSDSQE